MKTLEPITVGKYTFEVSVDHPGGPVVDVTVSCGTFSMMRKMHQMGVHDHSDEQFDRDLKAFALLRATELAGKMRSEELAKKYSSDVPALPEKTI